MTANQPLLDVQDLRVDYDVAGAASWRRRTLTVVRGVSFTIAPGETYGLVGESGSGKSTTGKAILRLADVSGGTVRYDGQDISTMPKETPLAYRRQVQAVYQDPIASLNPRHRVGRAITETLALHGIGDRAERRARALASFEQVGLTAAHLTRYPSEMSGGQLQRVAIARALVLEPRLVVCDEAVSALDLSTQAQVLNLLSDLRAGADLGYLFIAHDMAVVEFLAQRVVVLNRGRIVEQGVTLEVMRNPQHHYTRVLMAASPVPDPDEQARRRQAWQELKASASAPAA
jgi:ABC-type oligopeptide transport system ATPase subunit